MFFLFFVLPVASFFIFAVLLNRRRARRGLPRLGTDPDEVTRLLGGLYNNGGPY